MVAVAVSCVDEKVIVPSEPEKVIVQSEPEYKVELVKRARACPKTAVEGDLVTMYAYLLLIFSYFAPCSIVKWNENEYKRFYWKLSEWD
jgi:hypothetical protein